MFSYGAKNKTVQIVLFNESLILPCLLAEELPVPYVILTDYGKKRKPI